MWGGTLERELVEPAEGEGLQAADAGDCLPLHGVQAALRQFQLFQQPAGFSSVMMMPSLMLQWRSRNDVCISISLTHCKGFVIPM